MFLIINPWVIISVFLIIFARWFETKCCFRPSPNVILPGFNIPEVWGRKQFLCDGSYNSIWKRLHLYYYLYPWRASRTMSVKSGHLEDWQAKLSVTQLCQLSSHPELALGLCQRTHRKGHVWVDTVSLQGPVECRLACAGGRGANMV